MVSTSITNLTNNKIGVHHHICTIGRPKYSHTHTPKKDYLQYLLHTQQQQQQQQKSTAKVLPGNKCSNEFFLNFSQVPLHFYYCLYLCHHYYYLILLIHYHYIYHDVFVHDLLVSLMLLLIIWIYGDKIIIVWYIYVWCLLVSAQLQNKALYIILQ